MWSSISCINHHHNSQVSWQRRVRTCTCINAQPPSAPRCCPTDVWALPVVLVWNDLGLSTFLQNCDRFSVYLLPQNKKKIIYFRIVAGWMGCQRDLHNQQVAAAPSDCDWDSKTLSTSQQTREPHRISLIYQQPEDVKICLVEGKNVALQSVKRLLWVLMAFKVVMCENEDKQSGIH